MPNPNAPDSFRTSRLTAERLELRHSAEILAMHQDPESMEMLGGTRSESDTADYMARNLEHWAQHGFGIWVLRRTDGGAFVGRAGLRRLQLEGTDEVEIAYALLKEAWGQGLATEVASAVIEIAARMLALPSLVVITRADNVGSRRVMDKAGFQFAKSFERQGKSMVLYRLKFSAP